MQPEPDTVSASRAGVLASLIADRLCPRCYLADARGDRTLSYQQLAQAAPAWAVAVESSGVRPGSCVLLDAEDPMAFAPAFLCLVAAGYQVVPVDPRAPAADRARTVAATLPALIVTDRRRAGTLVAGLPRLLIDAGSGGPRPDPTAPDPTAPEPAPARAARTRQAASGAVRLATSGSTGEPKIVELDERRLLHVARAVAAHNRLTADDRGYNPLPLFHVNAQVVGLLSTLVAGCTLVLDRRFHRAGFWDLIDEQEITWINAVPAILSILTRDGLPPRPRRLRLIRSASAALPASVRDELTAAFGPIVVESYGMTEAASQITATSLDLPSRRGSAGRAVGVELQIRDETGRPAAPNVIGKVWIRGDGVIAGYLGGGATDRFDADGWLQTGDLAHLDADGFLYLAGRADDVINRGGELIYPREVEEVMVSDERVLDVVVVGRPDAILGAVPVAYVIPCEPLRGDSSLVADLGARCSEQLSRYKRPTEVLLVDDLPRTPTGKVRRHELSRNPVPAASR